MNALLGAESKKMKKWIGRFLVAAPLLALFASGVAADGWIKTLIAWAVSVVFLGMIFGGLALMDDDA